MGAGHRRPLPTIFKKPRLDCASVVQIYDVMIDRASDIMDTQDPIFQLLIRRSRGASRAESIIEELSRQLGVTCRPSERVLAAIALVRTGATPESIASLMSWGEFEEFCAGILRATGYEVKSNIVITKPRRQLDIFAETSDLALSIDCKHWGKGFSPSELERIAAEQVERSRLYKAKRGLTISVLPVIVTLVDAPTRIVSGVPVVPIFVLRDFLTSVSRFEPGLEII